MRKVRPKAGFVVVNMLALWLAMGIASIALWPIYRDMTMVIMVLVAVVLGSVIAILGAVFRWPAPIVLAATVVAFLASGVPVAVPSEAIRGILPSSSGLFDLVTSVALGWKQLLTISLPVGSYQALLVPFFALIMVLTVIALSLSLRSRFGDAATLGPGILFLTAIAFGAQAPKLPIETSLGLLAVLLLWIVWRRWYRRRAAIELLSSQARDTDAPIEVRADNRFVGLRTLFSAILILVLAAGTAVGAAAVVPPVGTRSVLRTTTTQPFEPRNYASPLSGFRTYWQKPKTDDVLLTVRGLPHGSRIRIATLDTYDGVVYSVGSAAVNPASGSFARVPFEYDQTGVPGKHVTLTVTDQTYSGVWLPTVGQFEKVSFGGPNASKLQADFFYNNTTGTAVDLRKLSAGDTYTLSTIVQTQPSLASLQTAVAGSAVVPQLTTIPAELTTTLNSWVADAKTPGEKLVAMITALRSKGYVSHGVGKEPASRSGHSADRINELLTDPQMIGDAEQYSVTAALMARELGFPARVVMGFVPKTTGAGTSEIKGNDVSAWIEVDTEKNGWVTVDPNPPARAIPVLPPKDPNLVAQPQTIVLPPVTQPNPTQPQPNPDSQQHTIPLPNPFLIGLLAVVEVFAWVLAIAFILLLPFLIVMFIKWRRRTRRRKAPTALAQITGGWQEFEDAVLDHGIQPPVAATRSEVATTVGGTRTAVLAAVTDRATFGPGLPDATEADLVWRSVAELTAALNIGKTRWERLRARISLRSLRAQTAAGYSVRKILRTKGSSS